MKAKNPASRKRQACSTLSVDDIARLPSLVGRLVNAKRIVDRYVQAQLSQGTREALADYPGPGSDALTMHGLLVKDLNKIICGPSIYNNKRFADIALRSRTQRLLSEKPEGEDCHRLNRLLLEDAYPRNLSREPISPSFEQQAKANVADAKAQVKKIRPKPWKRTKGPKWRRGLTKHFLERVLPHCRRGSEFYRKGRNDGFFLGGLIRDKLAAEAHGRLPGGTNYLREIQQDIDDWMAEKEERLATAHPRSREDYDNGFACGLELAQQQPMLMDGKYDDPIASRIWNSMPAIRTRCKSVAELYKWLYKVPIQNNKGFVAFQALCSRLGIKLRGRGRPRKPRTTIKSHHPMKNS